MSNYIMADNDAYVDVDEILERYRKSKTKIIFLVCAVAFIFWGTMSGYSSLQLSTSRFEALSSTTVEFAVVTAESEKCVINPSEKVCIKAKEIAADPTKATNIAPVVGSVAPTAALYDFEADPAAQLFAVILTQPLILRLQ